MQTFDYARAWHDLAIPAYNSLPDSLRALWADFQEADREILSERLGPRGERVGSPRMHQDSTLDVVGCPPDLRARMEAFPTHDLARASRAVYNAGHWDPGKEGGNYAGKFDKYSTGAPWKFANICDQILRARVFGAVGEGAGYIARDGKAPRSFRACEIHEGLIRETFSDHKSWSWFEIAYATDNYLSHNRVPRPGMTPGRWPKYDWRKLEAFGARCKAGEFATGDARPWLDLSRFMVEDKGYQGFKVRDKFAAHAEAREARKWAARGVMTV